MKLLSKTALRNRSRVVLALLSLAAVAHPALAQDTEPSSPDAEAVKNHDEGPGGSKETYLRRPGTLPRGVTQFYFPVQLSLTAGEVAKPTFVSPNVSHGFTKGFTARLLHSEGWRSPSDVTGVCFTGKTRGCPHAYNNVALDAVVEVIDGETFGLTVNAGTSFFTLDPLVLGAVGGASAEVHLAAWASWQVEMSAFTALVHRPSAGADRFGSTTRLFLEPSPRTLVFALAGVFAPFDDWSQAMAPLGVGGVCALDPAVDLSAQFILSDVRGGKAFDERQVTVALSYRL